MSENIIKHHEKTFGIKASTDDYTIRSDKEYARGLDDTVFTLKIRIKFRIPKMGDIYLRSFYIQLSRNILPPRRLVVVRVYGKEFYRIVPVFQHVTHKYRFNLTLGAIRIVEEQY